MYLSLSLVGSSVGRGGVLSVVVAAAAVLGGHYLTARCDKILSVHSGKEGGREEEKEGGGRQFRKAKRWHGWHSRERTWMYRLEREGGTHASLSVSSVLYSNESSLFFLSFPFQRSRCE